MTLRYSFTDLNRSDPERLYTVFAEVVLPTQNNEQPWVLRTFPHDFNNQQVLKMVAQSAVPVSAEQIGSICQGMVTHFSFVLTALDSRWSFGFVRHTPNLPTCLVLVSDLPWHETFYRLLNHISDLTAHREDFLIEDFLDNLYSCNVPQPGFQLVVNYNRSRSAWSHICCNHTIPPSIPEDRNLTEYYNACDHHIMVQLFTAMLHERRIVIVSRRLNRLSSCVQAANLLIYPMQWQHLFIPVLPLAVVDTLNAPMPYLIGVPSSTWERVRQSELGDVVVYHADQNKFSNPFRDSLPSEIEAGLKRKLKNQDAQLGDGFAQAFMHVLVILIGDYRSGFRQNPRTGKLDFDKERFLQAQPSSLRPFLEGMLQLQIFAEFVENRMRRVNEPISDRFEIETAILNKNSHKFKYKEWLQQKPASAVRSAYKQVKQTGNLVKDKSRKAVKDIQTRMNSGAHNGHHMGQISGPHDKLRRHSASGPPPLQRMHTSPNIRLTQPIERVVPPERPTPPRRPTSPPPAVPVVNDLICLDDSPKKHISGLPNGNSVLDGFEDSFVPLNGHTSGANGQQPNGASAQNEVAKGAVHMRGSTSARTAGGRSTIPPLSNSTFHTSASDNVLISKFYSDFDSRPSPVSPVKVQELIANFSGLQMNLKNPVGADPAAGELLNGRDAASSLPVLQPPPRKMDLKRHPHPSRPPRAHVLHLLNEDTMEGGVAPPSALSEWTAPQKVAPTNPFSHHL
ncbi:DENN domain-containing protein 1B-like isoform X3 [Varroa jacobsoni]|uniref:DENN domain-containing protein 1B-like isoform X3 n=1 Tax=Varroa jacobsoni TaxID=62625 RepID=UPI000BF3C15D|nr:DENN domain-containing protein 1B-like isoform X3 [Varroa jacobsoni]